MLRSRLFSVIKTSILKTPALTPWGGCQPDTNGATMRLPLQCMTLEIAATAATEIAAASTPTEVTA